MKAVTEDDRFMVTCAAHLPQCFVVVLLLISSWSDARSRGPFRARRDHYRTVHFLHTREQRGDDHKTRER